MGYRFLGGVLLAGLAVLVWLFFDFLYRLSGLGAGNSAKNAWILNVMKWGCSSVVGFLSLLCFLDYGRLALKERDPRERE